MPKASVIIATYNWSTVLPYSIGSVLEQTETDLEVLVVGDACSDDSERVVRSLADPRVKWFNLSERFGHQAGPNNEGLRLANGEFVFYLGHDDVWFRHHVEEFLEVFRDGADLVYGIGAMIDPEGKVTMVPARPTPFRRGMWIPPTVLAHRVHVVDKAGQWRDYRTIDLSPESDFSARIADAGFRVGFCPRLTAIKLPAANRKDVYKIRPSHEQAEWLDRIRSDDQLEAKLFGKMIDSTSVARMEKPILVEAKRLLRRVVRTGLRRRRRTIRARERIDETKRFKGSDP